MSRKVALASALVTGWFAIGGATSALGQTSAEEIWTSPTGPGVENWNSKVVSIGNHGTQVFSTFGPYGEFTKLYSAFDQSPPEPVWEITGTVSTMRHRVSSAKEGMVHAALYDVDSGGAFNTRNVIVKKFSSSSSTPDWSYTFPTETNGHDSTAVHVSDDGTKVVAAMHNIYTNKADVVVFDADSGTVTSFSSLEMLSPFKTTILSGDGRILYLRSNIKAYLFDVDTGLEHHSAVLFGGQVQSDAINGDGSVYAIGTNNDVKIWEDDGSGFYALKHTLTLPGENYCARMDISEDGSTIVLGYNYWLEWLQIRFRVFDVESGALLMDDSLTGTGSLQNLINVLSISADGSTFAAGVWGDEGGLVPEVLVYDSLQSSPIATFDMPGSVNALDLDDDGRTLAVATKNGHANVVGSGGNIALFELGERDFKLRGVPKIGEEVTFELEAEPFRNASLLTSTSLAATPMRAPGLGTLYLDMNSMTFTSMGSTDAEGKASYDLTLPNSASMVGMTLYFQGFSSAPRELSKEYSTVTILP